MRGLLLNYALEQAYRKGETVYLRKGTDTKEVSERRHLAQRDIYTNSALDDESTVAKKLKELKLKNPKKKSGDKSHLVTEYLDNISEILTALVNDEDEEVTEFLGAVNTSPAAPPKPINP